jgi:hypothetical protein
MTSGLSFSPFNEKKALKRPSINTKTFTKYSSKTYLTIVHLEMIDTSGIDHYHLQETKKSLLKFYVITKNKKII